jgi:hypothetical protein
LLPSGQRAGRIAARSYTVANDDSSFHGPPSTMPLNPLAPVTDYQSMLNRIFWFTSASALAAVWILRLNIPGLDALLSQVDFAVALGGGKPFPTPAGALLPALAIGIVTRVFRLHARLSDWLGIRESFDIEVIIGEFTRQLAIDLAPVSADQLRKARHGIMRKAFYPFVSGSQPAIDQQLVQQALDAWSWFWIGLELTLLMTLTGFGLIACGVTRVGFQTLCGAIAFATLAMPALRAQCQRYAVAQVRAILADPARATAARTAFDEFAGEAIKLRVAA